MGWQDAPLASPTGPKPAWSSAPLATQSNAPAGGAVPEDPRSDSGGFTGFLHRVGRMADVGGHSLVAGVERLGETGTNALGLGSVADYLGGEAKMNEQAANTPVEGTTDWQTVKAHPTIGNIGSYVAEQGAAALPSLGAAGVALPLFGASRLGEVAHTRAQNDGRQNANIMDVLKAAPSAAVDTLLMRGGLNGILSGSVGKAALREGITMGGMPVADYAGETVGTNKPFDPMEAADRGAAGLVAGLPLGAAGAGVARLRNAYTAKGVDTSHLSDEALTEGSLNGEIHPDIGPSETAQILQSAGVDPASVSPGKADLFAQRIQAARARPNTNGLGADEVARQNGIAESVAAGETDPAWMQAPVERTPPPDVTMSAAPEGIIRSDDTGAQAGVDRHRAASDNVLETAQRHADRDPVIREILDSSLSPDTKVGVLLDRLHKYVGSLKTPEQPAFPDAPEVPSPFQEPTADKARAHRLEPHSSLDRELAVTEQTESHGDPNAVSPKGARGSMQTMPGTLRDPGFGVRPAENDSPEELRRVGRDYYAALRQHYGSAEKAWAAYNDGPGSLDGAMKKYGAAWLDHMPEETRNYVRKNMAAIGGEPSDTVYRGPAPSEDPFRSDSGFERTNAPEEPLVRDQAGDSRTATGDSSNPFKEETDTPAGEDPGFWERRAQMKADELHAEWEASAKDRNTGSPGGDPSQKYGSNNYGQRPHMPEGSDTFAMTPEGHIADVNGKPVAFRNSKDAAKFAAKNGLGGDFERQVWGTNSERVVLTKRPGSTYGEPRPHPEGPAEPPAGRSDDPSQRLIPDWQKAPIAPEGEPSSRDTGAPGISEPKTAGDAVRAENAPPFAERGSVSDRPAGPERFDGAPPVSEGDLYAGGTYERPRPEADVGPAPSQPRNFLDAVVQHLNERSARDGVKHRLNASDAVNYGVKPDQVYVDAKAKYPLVKAHLQRIFSSDKAPLRSKAQPVKLHSLDDLGDRFDFSHYGIHEGERVGPEHIGQLLSDSIHGHEDAWDRTDPNYEKHQDWIARHNAAEEFASRYGRDWHKLSDEDLARLEAEHADDTQHFDPLNHVLGNEAPAEAEHGLGPSQNPAPDAEATRENSGGNERPERDAREAQGRGPAAEDALIPERSTDGRDALQRRADERLKPSADQKAPGSDGGLFDNNGKQGNVFGRLLKDEGGSLNLDAIRDTLFEKDADPGEIIRKVRDLARSPVKTSKAMLKGLDRFGSAVAYSSDGALRTLSRHYNSPTIKAVADIFQSRAGADDGTSETYDGALKRNSGRFRSRLDEALDPHIGDKASMERIRDLLADPGRTVRSTAEERAAAREVRDLLKDVIAYRKEAGEDIGEVKNYFPRVVDSLAVANEPSKFINAAEKLYASLGVPDPREAAEGWAQRILDTHAGLDGGEEFIVASGKPSSSKSREFGPAADRMLRDFMQKDPLLVLSDYVTGSVRRAEQTRRFGPKGEDGTRERDAWTQQHGDKSQWDVMVDKIRDELRASGEDAEGVVRQVKAIRDGAMGRLGTVGVRTSRAVSTIHAWNQVSTLQRVTLSSIGDLSMGFIGGAGGMKQGINHFATSIKEAARLIETLGKRDLSDGHRWAEAAGTIGHGTASQLIQARMDAAPGAVKHASLLNKFYHKVGIEQLTQGGRIAATENAKVFLGTLSDDLQSSSARTRQRADFYLKELGIKDPQGFGSWVRSNGVPDRRAIQHATEGSREAEYAAAVVRFADQTILMPSRAMKPVWANHPVGSLLFALQSYNAAFTQNVLKRVGRLGAQAVKTKDPNLLIPAAGLIALTGMTALQDYLRTALFGGKPQNDDATQYGLRILDRAGFTGMASPFFNALYGLKYHRSVSQSLQGSVLGRAGQAIDAGGGLFIGNSDKTNTAERKAAGLVYDLAIDPAMNVFGAKYLRGATGTAAIMGTGNKAGGVLPGDRDAFVDAVAGPEKKRNSGMTL